ncbi:hydroxylysine kinase [Ornithorhynchus anatinus]|uniref:Hydroxylysine kinase n=1 Tax=Ornithorhynchus anatinus TaxID=9258 RepID=A0A6I8PAN9_ORNAN|nr:hydroxylysine kinase [Ornithorhynchus anatinus]
MASLLSGRGSETHNTMSRENDQKSPLLTKPSFTELQAATLVESIFGLNVSKVKALPSYDDQNFHVHISKDNGTPEELSEYVLKITNSESSKNSDLIEVQSHAIMFLRKEGFPTAALQSTKEGNITFLMTVGCGSETKSYMMRLLTYLPGRPIAQVPATPSILYEIGKVAAKMDKTLQEKFRHPGINNLHRGDFIWNLKNVPLLEKYVHALDGNGNREIVDQVIQQFKDKILPKLNHFRSCINHGDFNDHNILVDVSRASPEDASYHISGILDFDDMSYGYYVFEVAITIMYMMIESKDPLPVGGHVLAGFESIVPLTAEERDALFLLVCGRFSQSMVMAAYTCLLYPENKEYLMITAKTGWKHLKQMFGMGQKAVENIWFEIAQSYSPEKPV